MPRSRLVAFYAVLTALGCTSAINSAPCGNGAVETGEQCDLGKRNGEAGACCSTTCEFVAAGTLCRSSAGICDLDEACVGDNADCPADAFKPRGSVCRLAAEVCDVPETCDGTTAVCALDEQAAAGTACRPSTGACDAAEACDGTARSCPPDVNACAGSLILSTALTLNRSTYALGDSVSGTVVFANPESTSLAVKALMITTRPPGGTHTGGPYDDLLPTLGPQTLAAGASLTVSASRTLKTTDPTGTWEAYATYQDASGAWHDGPGVTFTVTASSNFGISVPLVLSKSTYNPGDTVAASVTYANSGTAPITVQKVVITTRPPGGTHGGGPYDDLAPQLTNQTVVPGGTVLLSATRTLLSTDPAGLWEAYATYQDSNGAWHDGPSVPFSVAGASTPGKAAKTQQGVYPGYGAAGMTNLAKWEAWLGRKMKFIDSNLSLDAPTSNMWGFWNHSQAGSLWTRPDATAALTVGLVFGSQSGLSTRAALTATANGANDAVYQCLCDMFLGRVPPTAAGCATGPVSGVPAGTKLIARLGHEADCCYPWTFEKGNADVYKLAFQHVATYLRGCMPGQVIIDYNMTSEAVKPYKNAAGQNVVPTISALEAGYPGDAYVDVIGVDTYAWSQFPSYILPQLNTFAAFAVAHGKQLSVPEWGLLPKTQNGTGDDPVWIQGMYDFLNGLPATGGGSLLYANYFQDWGPASLEQYPNARARYLAVFGGP